MKSLDVLSVAIVLSFFCGCDTSGSGPTPTPAPESKPAVPEAPVSTAAPAAAAVAVAGSISGTALFAGADIPKMEEIAVKTDVQHCGHKVFAQNRMVNPANRGLKNVVVTVAGVQGGKKAAPATLTVANKNCSFDPHVAAAVAGSKLSITNEDPINHTTHPYLGNQTFFNVPILPGQPPIVRDLRRPGLLKLRCDIHDWMLGWVVVHDNPHFAVTDADGKFAITDLPPGTYTVTAWHEDLGAPTAKVAVEAGKAAAAKFEFGAGAGSAPAKESASAAAATVQVPEKSPLSLPLGLDPYEQKIPADNPITPEKIELGKLLYFDPRLSKDDTVSCASCHDPQKGYSNGAAFATGVGGKVGGRSAPTVINRLFSTLQFWDGRAASLEDQALGPIQNPIEMAMTLPAMLKKAEAIPGYAELFKKAFGTPEVNPDRIAKAIATFERTVVSGDSPFDRYENGDAKALTESQIRGLALFRGKAKCSVCHTGFNLTDEKYHNIGVGMDKPNPDEGRSAITKNKEDHGAVKTPTLRDIELTAPYFKDGSAKTLAEVVEFYDRGGIANPNLSKHIAKLGLADQEKKDLVEILKAFTGKSRVVVDPPKAFPQ
ncbi:MAG: hypothetical protein HY717_08100 [Planctomycetes bacterium]|nr:hypothetical protein [Planctomycetota bacterium]